MAEPPRTIPVHALADERIHLALPHLGRLKQGRLKTLCGLLAVSALSPFVLAEPERARCRTCFAGTEKPAKGRSQAAKRPIESKGREGRGPRSKSR